MIDRHQKIKKLAIETAVVICLVFTNSCTLFANEEIGNFESKYIPVVSFDLDLNGGAGVIAPPAVIVDDPDGAESPYYDVTPGEYIENEWLSDALSDLKEDPYNEIDTSIFSLISFDDFFDATGQLREQISELPDEEAAVIQSLLIDLEEAFVNYVFSPDERAGGKFGVIFNGNDSLKPMPIRKALTQIALFIETPSSPQAVEALSDGVDLIAKGVDMKLDLMKNQNEATIALPENIEEFLGYRVLVPTVDSSNVSHSGKQLENIDQEDVKKADMIWHDILKYLLNESKNKKKPVYWRRAHRKMFFRLAKEKRLADYLKKKGQYYEAIVMNEEYSSTLAQSPAMKASLK